MRLLSLVFVLTFTGSIYAQPVAPPDSTTLQRFEHLMTLAQRDTLYARPFPEIMQRVAEYFLGTPYVAGLLDQPPQETLICSLNGFDCVLFVESVLALARGIALQDYSFSGFQRRIEEQRYRGGIMNGYCSRLHYFSDWIADNQKKGIVKDITRQLGGEPFPKQLNFMTTHRASYPRLQSDSLYACIQQMESRLQHLTLYYIPQDRIHTVYDRLQAGDILALTTSVKGLDVAHTAIAYPQPDGSFGLIHASLSGTVKISPDLQQYVAPFPTPSNKEALS